MPLVLAIEPDLRQAAILKRIVREKVKADVVIVDSRDAAVEAIRGAVPDVVLVSALLSPRDEEELVAHLRTLDADYLQTHTIPQLASSLADRGSSSPARGLLKAFRRKKDAEPAVAGCDPELFADEIRTFLEQAEQRKRELQEERQFRADSEPRKASVLASSAPAAAAQAAPATANSAPSWDSPFEWRKAEPPIRIEHPSPEAADAEPAAAASPSPASNQERPIADVHSRFDDRESHADVIETPDIERVEVKETQIGEAGDAIARLVEARMAEAAAHEAPPVEAAPAYEPAAVADADSDDDESAAAIEPAAPFAVDAHPAIALDAVGSIELIEPDPVEPDAAITADADEDEVELSLDAAPHEDTAVAAFPHAVEAPLAADTLETDSLHDEALAEPELEDEEPIEVSASPAPEHRAAARDARLGPLASWARAERSAEPARGQKLQIATSDLISRLATPGHVAGVTYPRGVRIRRVRVAGKGGRGPASKVSGPVILSKKALDERRGARQ